MGSVLTFKEFIEKMHRDKGVPPSDGKLPLNDDEKTPKESSHKIEEDKEDKLPELEKGDYVEDRFGNVYEVIKTTKSYSEADSIDDWDQISKFKDNPRATFVIVWAKPTKQKKLVFVYGVKDDTYGVKKVDKKDKDAEDVYTLTFRKACKLMDDGKVESFKKRWRKYVDLVRNGEIGSEKDEKIILNQLLKDYGVLDKFNKVDESALYEGDDEGGDSKEEKPKPEKKEAPKKEDKKEEPKKDDPNKEEKQKEEPKKEDKKEEPNKEDKDDSEEKEELEDKEKELEDKEKELEDKEEQLDNKEKHLRHERHREHSHATGSKEGQTSDREDYEEEYGTRAEREAGVPTDRTAPRKYIPRGETAKTSKDIPGEEKTRPEEILPQEKGGQGSEGEGEKRDSRTDSGGSGKGSNSERDSEKGDVPSKAKKTVFFGNKDKIVVGSQTEYGSYEVDYGNKVYYIMPEKGEEEFTAYEDDQCKTKAESEHHFLKFKCKDVFNIDKFVDKATTYDEKGIYNSEEEAEEREKEEDKKKKEEEKEGEDKKDKKDK